MPYPSWRIIGRGVYWLSIPDVKSKLFENIWPIPNGVNYNAYLIADGDEYLLVDSSKAIFTAEELVRLIEGITDPSKIRKIAVLHTEPDHSGLISGIFNKIGNPVVYSTSRASSFMRSMFNLETNVTKDGDEINIGNRILKVIELPWIHWPDTMFLYLEDEKILFSSDAFGAFGALERPLFDDEIDFEKYMHEAKEYFATVVVAYRRMVLKALEKINRLGVVPRIIAPSHGVVLRSRIAEFIQELYSWCNMEKRKKITIVYGTMYGFTEKLAEFAKNTISSRVEVVMHNAVNGDLNHVLSDVLDSAGVLFITPIYEGNTFPPITSLIELMKIKKLGEGKISAIVVTKLWGGAAANQISLLLKDSGYNILSPAREYVNYPNEEDLRDYEAFLQSFVDKVLENV
ncbi:MAG: FprA family A-type flavoprotein [Candidatus Brockarchaeota archaeon]|nr:FprA family A-type flavoprotein [Candidatus Brockarchaeota archaeon]